MNFFNFFFLYMLWEIDLCINWRTIDLSHIDKSNETVHVPKPLSLI